jgi:hypothetical protein
MYTYFLESISNNNIEARDITNNDSFHNFLYILCYHVTDTTKYPFLQFMMEKIPFCNNFIKEQFTLPFVLFNDSTNIEEFVIDKVKTSLKNIGCDNTKITNEMYRGIVVDQSDVSRAYALVNITGIDISGLCLCRNSPIWFVLPSEIINTKSICNIDIDEEVTELFTNITHLGLLSDPVTSRTYILPDVAYTGGEFKSVEFSSVFGNIKSKEYDSCGEYYYFYKSFKDAIRYGGWTKNGGTQKIDKTDKEQTHNSSGRLVVDNEYGRYITGGINRHAVFIEGNIHIESGSEFLLNDNYIESSHPEPTINICYSGDHQTRPDILVKSYENFSSLSYHSLNKLVLDDSYIEINSNKYMIS